MLINRYDAMCVLKQPIVISYEPENPPHTMNSVTKSEYLRDLVENSVSYAII